MFAAVVVVFTVSWLPYHLFFLVSYHFPEVMLTRFIKDTYLLCFWLAMSNCAVNPFIYYFMSQRFRKYFNLAVPCLEQMKRESTIEQETPTLQL